MDKLIGLAVGADDYMTKPFSGRTVIRHGALTIDPARREAATAHGPASLTALDFDLLLAAAPVYIETIRSIGYRLIVPPLS